MNDACTDVFRRVGEQCEELLKRNHKQTLTAREVPKIYIFCHLETTFYFLGSNFCSFVTPW